MTTVVATAVAVAGLGGVVVVTAPPAAAAPAPIASRPAEAFTADALPTVQIDGVVWDQVVVGDIVYAGGNFTNARPAGAAPGTNQVPRSNLLAFNIKTGALVTSFAPTLNGQVKVVTASPDGTRVYVGGQFTTVNGQTRSRVAAFDTATGSLLSWAPAPNATVNALAVTDTAVYVGGAFSRVGSAVRGNLAAFSPSTGALLAWAPSADGGVQALVATPDRSRIIAAGSFGAVNGSTAHGMAALDAASATLLPWAANNVIHNYGSSSAMLSLSTDGSTIYSAGYWFGGVGNFEGVLAADPTSGEIKWLADCHGDTYDAAGVGSAVYSVSHHHHCENIGGFPDTNPRNRWLYGNAFTRDVQGTVAANNQCCYASFEGQGAPGLINWFPTFRPGSFTGKTQAGWAVAGNDDYLVMGGEFPSVNGTAQQGLVRFARAGLAPKKQGPQITGSAFNPSVVAVRTNAVRVGWTANWDRDDQLLTYRVLRAGSAAPLYTTTATSQFWNLPSLSFTDSTVSPGQTYRYRVQALDPDGNLVQSNEVSVTVPTSVSAYLTGVIDDGASHYWRMNGTTTHVDYAGSANLSGDAGVTAGGTGAISGDPDAAAAFSGTATGVADTTVTENGPNTFTAEAWVRTTSTSGGKILGFGNATTGLSSSYDRHVYMTNEGRIVFGVYPGAVRTVTGTKAYNDGQWHHVVASLSGAGMALYVDGLKVGADPAVTSAQPYPGYWRVGGDNLNGWPGQPTSPYLAGTIDEVAIYPAALTGAQIREHYTRSGRTVALPPAPSDGYGKAVYADEPTLYWRLGDTGTTAKDSGPNQLDGTYSGGVSRPVASPVTDPGSAATFNGVDGLVSSNTAFVNPRTYSTEIWFKTTSTAGGKLIGFGDRQTGTSGGYDRHVYMDSDGRLTFGTWTGRTNTVTTPQPANDGRWHHVVATQSADGMRLYLDGQLVGSNPETGAQDYTGYWRVGGDNHWGCCGPYLAADLDEAAVYDQALTAAQVRTHYQASPASGTNAAPAAAFTTDCTDASCAFDASGSTDADGTIAAYAWDFGDGGTSTGARPTHRYAASGTYSVTLTVTDDGGKTAATTRAVTVTVPAANLAPTAAATADCTELSCAFDGRGSRDGDGTIAAYRWDFGDGGTSTAASPTHAFAAPGTYAVRLTVTDDDGATDSQAISVTVARTPANAAPTAAFTASCAELACSFDGAGSTDSDGTVSGYAWDFGDGSTGTGAAPKHTYTRAGDYVVKLTVTDDDGATDTATRTVAVRAPASDVVVEDAFNRTVTRWGNADTGGAWTYSGSTFSTDGRTGNVRLGTAGSTATASLGSVSAQDVNLVADLAVDKLATGGGTYSSFLVRKVGTTDYRLTVQHLSTGTVRLNLVRTVNNTATSLRSVNVSGLSYAPDDVLRVRFTAVGNGTTTVTGTVWKVGSTEPASPQVSATDGTAALQVPGSFGLVAYLSGSTTNAPTTLRYDNLRLTRG